jgi:dTMP kinase
MEDGLKGKLITFEGAEGSGKSTQACLVFQYLKSRGIPVIFLREPGGVSISEKIRELLLSVSNKAMTSECEMLLYMAARAQLVNEKVIPALHRGQVVLCDRYLDSTMAYQGFGNGLEPTVIRAVGRFATHSLKPDLTLLFDIDAEQGLARTGKQKDRIEQRAIAYHRRVRKGYLTIAAAEPRRIKVIKANQTREQIFEIVRQYISALLALS